jgi:hypothetical protein
MPWIFQDGDPIRTDRQGDICSCLNTEIVRANQLFTQKGEVD